jgi:hypothetical protein
MMGGRQIAWRRAFAGLACVAAAVQLLTLRVAASHCNAGFFSEWWARQGSNL